MNTTNAAIEQSENSNVIQLMVVDGKAQRKPEKLYNKDGSVKRTHCNKQSGESSEVYAFKTEEDIAAMVQIFDKHITEAPDDNKRQIAYRNRLLFFIGMNVGIRASDLRTLKWSFFLNKDGTFKDVYVLQPMKQRKQGKFVKLYFNQTVKKAVQDYLSEYPYDNIDEYLFTSRKGEKPIVVASLWRIISDTAKEAGIVQNIGSHSLRKSWGYWCWHNAKDKQKALVVLQCCFSHSSTQVTMKYIGLQDEEVADMYYSVELGLEYM